MNIIFVVGIFLSLFQFVLLLNKKSKSIPDKVLAIWMLVIGVHLASYYLYHLGYWDTYPHLVGITVPFPLFYGPLLYLYVLHSLKSETALGKKDYIHFVPILMSYLYMIKFYFFYSAEEKRLVDMGEIDDFDSFTNVLLVSFILSGIGYTLVSYQLLSRHKRLVDNNFSNTEGINLNWLKSIIWAVGLILLIGIAVILLRNMLGLEYSFNLDFIFYSMIVLAIISLGYFGIRHQNIFIDNEIIVKEARPTGEYKNSGLKDGVAQSIHINLLQVMLDEKPYLEPKLTLTNLSSRLEISPNHLSQIINQYEEQNFNDFINKYRVEEFINKASQNSNYSFLAIAYDSGFNSKSTFNSVFKKQKGVTPSQFMSTSLHESI